MGTLGPDASLARRSPRHVHGRPVKLSSTGEAGRTSESSSTARAVPDVDYPAELYDDRFVVVSAERGFALYRGGNVRGGYRLPPAWSRCAS